ncbi:uncharacterized protein LOC105804087 [Gossypium raimondii]|uniref:Uncharacterized protein n=1 Tax=Gossypium raimondii TaxID=29730 RepID=A0A0D2TJW3_GOSRA|nr:uncharacterized protein LOC105804087 [Gossypium raimondii]KJB43995.1 hypothetical protein B456_007G228500 [Gossypium raimondii]MBA0590637.1 hypothetical protein [Gossypium raimondii]
MAATATTTQTHPPNPLLKAPKGPTRSKLVCFSFAAYSKTIIDHLKSLHIPVFSGLTDQEFSSIESTFHFTFPPDLRSILQEGLPVHPSFPNWRSSSPQQLIILLNLPSLSLYRNIRFHNFWSDSWGSKPSNTNDALALVKDLLRNAPLLVPVYRNCYIPSTPNLSGNPVFYVDTEEIRILSFDITRFFQELELSTRGGVSKPFMRKKANSVNINVPAWAATAPRRIEFWTEVAGRGRRTVARGVTGGWWNRDEVEREGESRLGACMEEEFWRLREGGWNEEEVREMMMMIDGSDHNENKEMSGTQLVMDGEDAAWHVRVLSVVLLRAGWSREDVVYSLDLHDVIDDNDDDESMN